MCIEPFASLVQHSANSDRIVSEKPFIMLLMYCCSFLFACDLQQWRLSWSLKLISGSAARRQLWPQSCGCDSSWLFKLGPLALATGQPGPPLNEAQFQIWRLLGRLLNFSSGIIGKRPFLAKSWPEGNSRSLPGAPGSLLRAFWSFWEPSGSFLGTL